MKTAGEIKTALGMCRAGAECKFCPYTFAECTKNQLEKDALQYIAQLEAKVPRWISVEERLPEYWMPVIVFMRHRYTPDDGYSNMRIIMRSEEYGWARLDKHYEITHWMPMPEPPVEV